MKILKLIELVEQEIQKKDEKKIEEKKSLKKMTCKEITTLIDFKIFKGASGGRTVWRTENTFEREHSDSELTHCQNTVGEAL